MGLIHRHVHLLLADQLLLQSLYFDLQVEVLSFGLVVLVGQVPDLLIPVILLVS